PLPCSSDAGSVAVSRAASAWSNRSRGPACGVVPSNNKPAPSETAMQVGRGGAEKLTVGEGEQDGRPRSMPPSEGLGFFQNRRERRLQRGARGHLRQQPRGHRNVRKIPVVTAVLHDVAEGPERLHQP